MWIAGAILVVGGAVALGLVLGGWAAPFAILALLAVGAAVAWRGFRRGRQREAPAGGGDSSSETFTGGKPDAPEPEGDSRGVRVERV